MHAYIRNGLSKSMNRYTLLNVFLVFLYKKPSMMREQVIFLKSPHMEHWITMVLYIYIFSSWLYKDHQQTRTLKKCSSREKMNTY